MDCNLAFNRLAIGIILRRLQSALLRCGRLSTMAYFNGVGICSLNMQILQILYNIAVSRLLSVTDLRRLHRREMHLVVTRDEFVTESYH